MFKDSVCIILKFNLLSSVTKYTVPPSELEITLDSFKIFSSKISIFFSLERAIPISINFLSLLLFVKE